MKLVDALKDKQGERTQAEFARELEIDQPTLSKIYSNERGISRRLARRIVQLYPDLEPEVVRYVLTEPANPTEDPTEESEVA